MRGRDHMHLRPRSIAKGHYREHGYRRLPGRQDSNYSLPAGARPLQEYHCRPRPFLCLFSPPSGSTHRLSRDKAAALEGCELWFLEVGRLSGFWGSGGCPALRPRASASAQQA